MPTPTIDRFVVDDENEAKIGWHCLSTSQVREVLRDDERIIIRNRSGRRASHLMIGRDRGGRCIAIPAVPTSRPLFWRPVTAWTCKASEQALLPRRRWSRSDMDDDELRELQDPDNWDWDSAEVMPPVPNAGAAVLVTFAGEDFDRVAREAKAAGMKLTGFIREAALEKADQRSLQ